MCCYVVLNGDMIQHYGSPSGSATEAILSCNRQRRYVTPWQAWYDSAHLREEEGKRRKDGKRQLDTWTETAGEGLDQYLAEIRMTAMKQLFPWYTIRGSNLLSVRPMDEMSHKGLESGSNLLETYSTTTYSPKQKRRFYTAGMFMAH